MFLQAHGGNMLMLHLWQQRLEPKKAALMRLGAPKLEQLLPFL
jgi:hypothetical protein